MAAQQPVWRRQHSPRIGRDEALRIASAVCVQHGIPWQEPVVVSLEPRDWVVHINSTDRTGSTKIRIRRRTGEVRKVIITPK